MERGLSDSGKLRNHFQFVANYSGLSPKHSPPPAGPFWQVDQYPIIVEGVGIHNIRLELMQPRRNFKIASPVNPQLEYPESVVSNYFLIDSTRLISLLADEGGFCRLRLHV